MLPVTASLLMVVSLVAVGSSSEAAEPPTPVAKPAAKGKIVRTDSYGDPLPNGAIARLGTLRFRLGGSVKRAALSPHGKVFAVSEGSAIRLCDPTTGRELHRLAAQADELVFAPDSRLLASRSNSDIHLWDVVSGKRRGQLSIPSGYAGALAFSPDGMILAAGCDSTGDKVPVYAWEVATGRQFGPFPVGHNYGVQVAVSSHGKMLASWGYHFSWDGKENDTWNQALQIWDLASAKELRLLQTGSRPVASAVFSGDAKRLVTVTDEGSFCIWETASGMPVRQFQGEPPSPPWKIVALASTPALWRGLPTPPPTGQVARSGDRATTRAGDRATTRGDAETLVTQHGDTTFEVWDTGTGKRLHRIQRPQCSVAGLVLPAAGPMLCWGIERRAFRLWKVPDSGLPAGAEGPCDEVVAVAVAPDAGRAYAASRDGAVWEWTATSGRYLHGFSCGQTDAAADSQQAFTLVFSPNARYLAGTDAAGPYRLWDVRLGKAIRDFQHTLRDPAFAFSADGERLAVNGTWTFAGGLLSGEMFCVWDLSAGRTLPWLQGSGQYVRCLALDAKGKRMAGGGYDVGIWETATGKEQFRFSPEDSNTEAIALSPDGRLVALGQRHKGVGLHAVSGKHLLTLGPQTQEHDDKVLVTFSPDGRTLATVRRPSPGAVSQIQLWEVASAQLRSEFAGHHGMVTCLAFSQDGTVLASGSTDTTVLLWNLTGLRASGKWPRTELTAEDLERLWRQLASPHGSEASTAIWTLVAASKQAVPFVRKRLPPAAPPDPEALARLIADLDSKQFAVRQKATAELIGLGEQAEPALRKAMTGKSSEELRRRVEGLLSRLRQPVASPPILRALRAIEVLEKIGTRDAEQALRELAEGVPEARVTQQAKMALERIGNR
jgi:WD40 repeat protein